MDAMRSRRRELGLSLLQAAWISELSPADYASYEAGKILPDPEVAQRISSALLGLPVPHRDMLHGSSLPCHLSRVEQSSWWMALHHWHLMQSTRPSIPRSVVDWSQTYLQAPTVAQAMAWLQLAELGADPLLASPVELGFQALELLDERGQLCPHRSWPGLYWAARQKNLYLWPQLCLAQEGRSSQVDALILVERRRLRAWMLLQIDGSDWGPGPRLRVEPEEIYQQQFVERLLHQIQVAFLGRNKKAPTSGARALLQCN